MRQTRKQNDQDPEPGLQPEQFSQYPQLQMNAIVQLEPIDPSLFLPAPEVPREQVRSGLRGGLPERNYKLTRTYNKKQPEN